MLANKSDSIERFVLSNDEVEPSISKFSAESLLDALIINFNNAPKIKALLKHRRGPLKTSTKNGYFIRYWIWFRQVLFFVSTIVLDPYFFDQYPKVSYNSAMVGPIILKLKNLNSLTIEICIKIFFFLIKLGVFDHADHTYELCFGQKSVRWAWHSIFGELDILSNEVSEKVPLCLFLKQQRSLAI
ncbi:hypothetical protein BpHYR1_029025 [Brachionus plicatilis]|uniref:Uncharacterized protein n=1 Tax=Brachionus plicatilis TaxID=10195 RepID=A0A3M7SW60_BRAPC|nr:hypothetical protein BpHYR1_029025 [Brachionus plicatilis]